MWQNCQNSLVLMQVTRCMLMTWHTQCLWNLPLLKWIWMYISVISSSLSKILSLKYKILYRTYQITGWLLKSGMEQNQTVHYFQFFPQKFWFMVIHGRDTFMVGIPSCKSRFVGSKEGYSMVPKWKDWNKVFYTVSFCCGIGNHQSLWQ